jgi:uncharacterized integral membrane protein
MKVVLIVGIVLVVIVGALIAVQAPELKRYIKIKQM